MNEVSSDEEIARDAVSKLHYHTWKLEEWNYNVILAAIRKAKSQPPNYYPSVCTNCWWVQKDAKTCARCKGDSLQPVICDTLFQSVSEPKESEEKKENL